MRFHFLLRTAGVSTSTAMLGLAIAIGTCDLSSAAVHFVDETLVSDSTEAIAAPKPHDIDSKRNGGEKQDDREKRDSGKHRSKGKHKKQGHKKQAEMKRPADKKSYANRPRIDEHVMHRSPPHRPHASVNAPPRHPIVPFNAMHLPIQARDLKLPEQSVHHDEILSTLRSIERTMKNIESMMRDERSTHPHQPRFDQSPQHGGPQHGGPGQPYFENHSSNSRQPEPITRQLDMRVHDTTQHDRTSRSTGPQDMAPRNDPNPGPPHFLHESRVPQIIHPGPQGNHNGPQGNHNGPQGNHNGPQGNHNGPPTERQVPQLGTQN